MIHPRIANKSRFIFDFDKTIATLQIDWTKWRTDIGDIFRRYEPEFDLDRKGQKIHPLENNFFQKYGTACRDQARDLCEAYEREHTQGIIVHQPVIDIIKSIEAGKLHVWSSNTRSTVQKHLKELGILGKFDTVVTRDDVFYLKPHIEGFSLIQDDVPLSQYVFFGDSVYDRGAAAALGIDYIDVTEL